MLARLTGSTGADLVLEPAGGATLGVLYAILRDDPGPE
jgi:hypothetical protein